MNTHWAIKQLNKGKKVRQSIWDEDEYIMKVNTSAGPLYVDNDYCPYQLYDDADNDEWELYKGQ